MERGVRMSENPKVFISYSHQGREYEEKVFEFANRLRREGIDASIDLYEEAPKEGWPRWMENQIRWADYVIVLVSKSYYDKCYSQDSGKGIHWEVNIVYQLLYDSNCETTKFIPAFFDKDDEAYIPTPLKSYTYYNISDEEQFDKLYWRLRGVSQYKKPELGKLRPLEPKKQKTHMYLTTPIDVDKWNAAKWKGMLYCFRVNEPPILGILFTHYDEGIKIFEEWRENWGNGYVDENLIINYVVPPFASDCKVYKDAERNYGKGYFVYIGPNIDESIKRATNIGISLEELLITAISRNIWVDEQNGTDFRDAFVDIVSKIHDYRVVPAALKDANKPLTNDNVILGFEYAIKLRNFTAKIGKTLDKNDVVSSVLKEPVKL